MSGQKRTQPSKPKSQKSATDQAPTKSRDSSLADGLDDILDEIDEVLETNAEEFVKSYVQKGGQ